MSFIQETYKCTECNKVFNVALGTFGYGMPKECPFCKKPNEFEHVGAGWSADNYGKLKTNILQDDF